MEASYLMDAIKIAMLQEFESNTDIVCCFARGHLDFDIFKQVAVEHAKTKGEPQSLYIKAIKSGQPKHVFWRKVGFGEHRCWIDSSKGRGAIPVTCIDFGQEDKEIARKIHEWKERMKHQETVNKQIRWILTGRQ